MLEVFAIVARESAELALIVYCLIDGLPKADARRARVAIVASALLGGAIGVALAVLLGMAFVPAWLQPLMSMLLALCIIGMATGSLETIPRLRRSVVAKVSELPGSLVVKAAVVTGFIAGAREAMESAVPILAQWGALGRLDLTVSVVAGLLVAGCLGMAWPQLRDRIGARALFRASALLLALIAVDMLIGSLDALLANLASRPPGHLGGMETVIGTLPASQSLRATLMAIICLLALRRWWRELR